MTKTLSTIVGACLLSLFAADAVAQDDPVTKAQVEAEARARQEQEAAKKERERRIAEEREFERQMRIVIPLDVQVVVSRYQGEKRTSNAPYSVMVNAVHPARPARDAQPAQLRMGAQIPLPAMAEPKTADGKPLSSVTGVVGGGPVEYKEIGTSIDASAKNLGDGSFELAISVQDTSVYLGPASDQPTVVSGVPVLRTFKSSNHLVLKDGQTKQFTLAADRISGETLRVDVTLKVMK